MSAESVAASRARLWGARVGAGAYAFALLIATSIGVGAAARGHLLIPVALPFAGVLIGALRLVRPTAERHAWALFTVWLGTTYLQTGAGTETVLSVAYLALALAGSFVSPWFLVAAWAFHPVWDLLPRTLPDLLQDLPMACLLFDGAVAVYLGWAARTGWFGPRR